MATRKKSSPRSSDIERRKACYDVSKEQFSIPSAYRKLRDTSKGHIVKKEGGRGFKYETEAQRIERIESSPSKKPEPLSLKVPDIDAPQEKKPRNLLLESLEAKKEKESKEKAEKLKEREESFAKKATAKPMKIEACKPEAEKSRCYSIVVTDNVTKQANEFGKGYHSPKEAYDAIPLARAEYGDDYDYDVMTEDAMIALKAKGYKVNRSRK